MAAKTVNATHTTVSAATSAGLVTVASSTGFAVKARVWLGGVTQTRLDYNTKTAGWNAGETITGDTSAATATLSSVVGGGAGAAAGTIILTGVTGTFQAGETITGTVSGASVAKATAAQYQFLTGGGNIFCSITSIPDATHVKLRRLPDPGMVLEDKSGGGGNNVPYPNYGSSDVSSFNTYGGFLDQDSQIIYITNADNSLPTFD